MNRLITCENLQTSQMGVLAILMIFDDSYLNQESPKHRPSVPIDCGVRRVIRVVGDWANSAKVNIDPSLGLFESHFSKFLQIVAAHTSAKLHLGGSVRLVVLEVKEDAHMHD